MNKEWPGKIFDSAIIIAINSALAYFLGDLALKFIWNDLSIPGEAWPDINIEQVFEIGGIILLVAYAISVVAYIPLRLIHQIMSIWPPLAEFFAIRGPLKTLLIGILFLMLCVWITYELPGIFSRGYCEGKLVPSEVVFAQDSSVILPDSTQYFGTKGDYHIFVSDAMTSSCSVYLIHKAAVLEMRFSRE